MKKMLKRKLIVLGMEVVLGITSIPAVTIHAEIVENNSNKIHFIALTGHSDAILLESNGRFGMVDSGEDSDYPDGSDSRYPLRSGITKTAGFEDEVIAYMKSVGVTKENFEFYIGTHPHSDHIGSADEIIREFEPERVYIMEYSDEYISSSNNLWDNLYVYDNMIEAAQEVGAVLIQNFDENAPMIPEQDSDEDTSGDSSAGSGDGSEGSSTGNGDASEDSSTESGDSSEDSSTGSGDGSEDSSTESGDGSEDSSTESGDGSEDSSTESEDGSEDLSTGSEDMSGDSSTGNEDTSGDTSTEIEDDREYTYLSQDEIVELYDVDPLNPDDPQAVDSEPDDGSGFPILLSDDPNSTIGDSFGPTTGNPNFSLGEMHIQILNYSDDYKTTSKPDCNYFSLGVLVEVNGYRTFLSGDICNYDGDEDRLAAYLGEVDVLKLGHHGLASSNTVNYLHALKPDYAVSTGVFAALANADGRLETFDRLAESGTRLYFSREYANKLGGKSIILGYDGQNIECNVPEDASMIYECDAAPYLYCYKDGYKSEYTGFVTSKGNKYYFENSVNPLTSQWVSSDGNWYYVKEDGTIQTGWMGNYYFDENGVWNGKEEKGKWMKDRIGWWYLYPDGTYPQNRWETIDGKQYYFDAEGYMKTGWIRLSGVWYYLGNTGAMTTGWQKVSGKWYYMNAKGQMQTGWQTISGKRYYLTSSGDMRTGWLYWSGKWYYLSSSGDMQTGWQKSGNFWYYMDSSGIMQTGWRTIYGKKYYFDNSGAMAYGWKKLSGVWYYFGSENDGAMKTGWVKSGSKWFYMNKNGEMQANCWIGNYYVDSSGAWVVGKVE